MWLCSETSPDPISPQSAYAAIHSNGKGSATPTSANFLQTFNGPVNVPKRKSSTILDSSHFVQASQEGHIKDEDYESYQPPSRASGKHYPVSLGVPALVKSHLEPIGTGGDRDTGLENLSETELNEADLEGEGDGDGDGPDEGAEDTEIYCHCNRVSYGNMIGCDGEDCKREWFHLACVGLTNIPLGEWYCDDCLEKRRIMGSAPSKKRRT